MKLRNKLSYIALGGLLMLIGMLASSMFMPNFFAQREKFGDIVCTSLTVVDDEGEARVLLSTNPFSAIFSGFDDKAGVFIGMDGYGGRVEVSGRSKGSAIMSIDQHGNGIMSTWDKHGYSQ